MKIFTLLSTIIWVGSTLQTAGSDNLSLDEHLEPLRPLLDKTWKGTFSNSTPDKPIVDVARWERALNGQTVRRIHSVNDGAYGGEALLFWDAQQNVISFYYVTTGGFRSMGTLEFKDGKFIGHEDIQGNADGITQVRSTSELLPNGKFHVRAEYLKNGHWIFGREITYEEEPNARVVFK